MATLYELTHAYRNIAQALEAGCDDMDELAALCDQWRDVRESLTDKLAAYVRLERNLRALAESAREEAARLAARAATYEKQRQALKETAGELLAAAGIERLRTDIGTVYWHTSACVEVSDETLVPTLYKHAVWQVHRDEIRKALQRGEDVPGIALNPRRTLAVR